MWQIIAALVGTAVNIGSSIAGRVQRKAATDEALVLGAENLAKGQNLTDQNAQQLAQDNIAVLSLSGVDASFGTAAQLHTQNLHQRNATLTQQQNSFDDWRADVLAADRADKINTVFSVLGGVASGGAALFSAIEEEPDFIADAGKPYDTDRAIKDPSKQNKVIWGDATTKGDVQ